MKLITTFVLVLLLTIGSPAAISQQISGLGEFKIGMTYGDFESWVKDNNYEIINITRSNRLAKSTATRILYPLAEAPDYYTTNLVPTGHGKTLEVSYLEEYKNPTVINYVINNIDIETVTLLFRHNTLIAIESYLSPELENALDTKYGVKKEQRTFKSVSCVYKFTGAHADTFSESTEHYVWPSEKGVLAKGYVRNFYSDKCQPYEKRELTIEKSGSLEKYNSANYKERTHLDLKDKAARTKAYNKTLDKL